MYYLLMPLYKKGNPDAKKGKGHYTPVLFV
jgi:hypothetical protein